MEKEKIAEKILELVKIESSDENSDGGLAQLLIRHHNMIVHSVPTTDWYDSTQNDLFTLWKLIEIIENVEKDMNIKGL
jgi:hypothetical protein